MHGKYSAIWIIVVHGKYSMIWILSRMHGDVLNDVRLHERKGRSASDASVCRRENEENATAKRARFMRIEDPAIQGRTEITKDGGYTLGMDAEGNTSV